MCDEFNNAEDASTLGFCVHHLLEHAASRFHERTALICANTAIKYDAINALSNQLAHAMLDQGIGRGTFVAVALERSSSLVVALLAVLKTGAAYLSRDPTSPSERLRYMLDDAFPSCILVNSSTKTLFTSWKGICFNIDNIQDVPHGRRNPQTDVQADDLAYIIYNSGSTGRPKGVEITHGAVSNILCSMMRRLGCDKTERFLAVTPVCFDIAVLELFLPLLSGAVVIMAQTSEVKNPHELIGLMKRHQITTMQATPFIWQMLLDCGLQEVPRLTNLLCGGNKLPRKLAESLLPCADSVWNLYGPTEATACASAWRAKSGEEVKIGRPVANTRFYVMRDDLSLTAAGEVGELYIGGAGLARGYHNNPKLTRSSFIQSPFHAGLLYHTGDLACFDSHDLRVLGRSDAQVKIHRHCIGLGDVQDTIASDQYISQAAVTSREDKDKPAACFIKSRDCLPKDDAASLEKLVHT